MSNPYAAPKARVEDSAPAGEPVFFAVSRTKLAVMSVATFALYQIYWFYKNWKAMQATGKRLNAPIRSVFFPLTAFWLFRHMRERAVENGVEPAHEAGNMATLLFFIYFGTVWLPDPWWVLTYLNLLPMFAVQATADRINLKLAPDVDPNARFSGWNIFGIVVGLAVYAFYFIELYGQPG